MKNNKKIITNLIILILLTLTLAGCGSETKGKSKSDISIYYINKDETKIVSEPYKPKETESKKLIFEYLDKLYSNGHNNNHLSAIPSEVEVNGFNLLDGMLYIDFNEHYTDMESTREVLCRAAVVMTISQIPEVEYVSFTVNNQPLSNGRGSFIGAMQPSDFVSDFSDGNNEFAKADFKLYFANEQGDKLKEYILQDANYGEKSKEQFIVEQLIKGPDREGYTATLSNKLKLINIVTANNICYVDFESSFESEQSGVANNLVIYSIVNSLSELSDVHKVQISINGDSSMKYHGDIGLSEPFIRNLDVIETK